MSVSGRRLNRPNVCGDKPTNDGVGTRALQAYLRHKNIQSATRYTALEGFWRD
jgi:hypothetical protein